MLLDSHVHLDRYPQRQALLERVEAHSVACVTVTETPAEYQRVRRELGGHPLVEVALGLHPLRAGELEAAELERFERLLGDCAVVGEVGLDGSAEGRPTREAQGRAFRHVLACAVPAGRLLSVHSRGAEPQVVDMLAGTGARAVLHWFRGNADDARAAVRAGLLFSVNPAMTASPEGRALLEMVPGESVLTETDGPYTEVDGRPSAPPDVEAVVEALGQAWAVEPGQAARRVADNWARVRAGS